MVEQHKKALEKQLWNIANALRGNMSADEFRDYILGFIFYKYLSERMDIYADELLKEDGIKFDAIDENTDEGKEYLEAIQEEAIDHLGYFLKPSELFHVLAQKGENGEFILEALSDVLNHIEQSTMGTASEDDFNGLFDDLDLTSNKLGKTEKAKNELISKILVHLDDIDFLHHETEIDVLGDAYEYLIGQFASGAGKKAGEFYTPPMVSKLLAKLVTMGKDKLRSVYDPTCGSGSLLLRVAKEVKEVGNYYGQESNPSTYNLARMNMILHGVHYRQFNIQQDDTLEQPHHIEKRFEAVVANPPFSVEWSASTGFLTDERFQEYGKLAPKKKADFAFVQHMVHQLDEDGTMAVVLPHGVLYRGSAEGHIRSHLVTIKNCIDAVITLPENLFYGTAIPTCIIVFKKNKTDKDILFINASGMFTKEGNKNALTSNNVNDIIEIYNRRENIESIANVASLDEVINKNKCNLNLPRYVDIFGEEDDVNVDKFTSSNLNLYKKLETVQRQLNSVASRLGVPDSAELGKLKEILDGDIRFKKEDGSNYPVWQEVSISEAFNFYSTNSLSRAKLNFNKGKALNIHYGDIHTQLPSLLNASKSLLPFINEEENISKLIECQVGDIVLADASEDYKDIGKSVEIVSIEKQPVYAGLHTFLLRPKKPHFIGFMGYLFQTYKVRKQMMRLATGVSVLGLSKSSLSEIKIRIPSFDEQKEIVTLLNLLNEESLILSEINLGTAEIKKGLMQQLL